MDISKMVVNARRKGAPLISVNTADAQAAMDALIPAITAGANGKASKLAFLRWDSMQGLVGLNENGQMAGLKIIDEDEDLRMSTTELDECLSRLVKLPEESVVFILNAHRWLSADAGIQAAKIAQGIYNLRDPFKATGRTLILFAPSIILPAELSQDALVIDESLPSDAELSETVLRVFSEAGLEVPAGDIIDRAVDALRGLASFPAEQSVAMSLSSKGLNIESLWMRKRAAIEQTQGIKFALGGDTYDGVGGVEQVKCMMRRRFSGPNPPRVIVFVDEIEKVMGGSGGRAMDGGVSDDIHRTLLTEMEDHAYKGMVCVGPPGCTKSLFARATAATFGVPCIELDLSAAKGGVVGESERNIRQLMKVLHTVAGEGGAYFIATCNQMTTLSPELLRRFRSGVWFFDLPTAEEKETIWDICLHRFGLAPRLSHDLPEDGCWTGADIRNCCENAYDMACSLQEAAKFLVPVCKSDPDAITRLRKQADGRFHSASYEGAYKIDGPTVDTTTRRISLD